MVFEKLANGIIKHSKLIIAIWIIALICAAPCATKATEVLSYSSDNMAGSDSESLKGMAILSNEFYVSESNDTSNAVLLVITFTDKDSEVAIDEFVNSLKVDLVTYVDKNGDQKLDSVSVMETYHKDANAEAGMTLAMVSYSSKMMADKNTVINDTPELRNWISEKLENNPGSYRVYVSGSPAISYDMQKGSTNDVSHIDVFSVLLILILVGLFFRSIFASAMPPITIGVAIAIAFCALFFVGSFTDIFFITEMFIIVSMLGAGCDYCIFIVARYREERRKGADHQHAMRESIVWAGESITTSGISVMIGFGAMSICSFSMISGMGIMLAIGIAIALVAALTLITSILNIIGEKIFWPSKIESFQNGSKSMNGWYGKCAKFGEKYFHKSVKFSIKHAKAIVIATILFTVPMTYIVISSPSSYDMMGTMLTGESQEGLNAIEEYTNGGIIMPDYEIIELNESLGTITKLEGLPAEITAGMVTWSANSSNYLNKISALSSTLSKSDSNIGEVVIPYKWTDLSTSDDIPAQGEMTDLQYLNMIYMKLIKSDLPSTTKLYLHKAMMFTNNSTIMNTLELRDIPGFQVKYDNPVYASIVDYIINYIAGSIGGHGTADKNTVYDATYVKVTIITKEQSMSDRSMDTLHKVNDIVHDFANNTKINDSSNDLLVAGTWLTGSAAVMYEISGTVYKEFTKVIALAVLLIFFLLFFVMRSYLTPLRSIITILMSVVWTVAITHLLFTSVLGFGVIWLIPIVLIVICLGLGMDYDILLTTRIKENYVHKGMPNEDAISEAVINSGSVITICGLIMGGAFGTLMLSKMVMLQEFGFALCFAIIIDALVVRTYIVPAIMYLMGDWCWKGPKFLKTKKKQI